MVNSFKQVQTCVDPHLVRLLPENSSKNLDLHIKEDDSCANNIQEPNNNGKSELSENVNHLKGVFVTTVKEVSAATKTRKEDLDNAQTDDGQGQKGIFELKQDSTDLHIEEHVNIDNQAECEAAMQKTKLEEERVVKEQSAVMGDNCIFQEERREDAVTDQIDHIAGEHFPFNLCFLSVPDPSHLSPRASLSSLHLQKKVGKWVKSRQEHSSGWGAAS